MKYICEKKDTVLNKRSPFSFLCIRKLFIFGSVHLNTSYIVICLTYILCLYKYPDKFLNCRNFPILKSMTCFERKFQFWFRITIGTRTSRWKIKTRIMFSIILYLTYFVSYQYIKGNVDVEKMFWWVKWIDTYVSRHILRS